MQVELAILIFAEVKYLVDKPLENPYVLSGNIHKIFLQGGEVGGLAKLLHRLCNQGERSPQIMGDISEKHEFRLCGLLQLLIKIFLLVALLLHYPVVFLKLTLMTAVESVKPQKEEKKPDKKDQDCYKGIYEGGLH